MVRGQPRMQQGRPPRRCGARRPLPTGAVGCRYARTTTSRGRRAGMRAGGWGREVLSRFSVSRSHRRAEWIEHDRRFRHDIGIVRSRRDRRSGERLHRVSSAEVRGRSTVEEDRVGADSAVLDVEGRLVLYLDVQVRLVGVAGVAARPTRWRSRRCVDEERRRGGPPPGRPRKPRRPTPGHRVRRRATRRTCREGWPQPAGPGRTRSSRTAAPRLGGRAGAGSLPRDGSSGSP